jgi:hypothetical protein
MPIVIVIGILLIVAGCYSSVTLTDPEGALQQTVVTLFTVRGAIIASCGFLSLILAAIGLKLDRTNKLLTEIRDGQHIATQTLHRLATPQQAQAPTLEPPAEQA